MDAMHVRRADVYPRVSDHMQDIIDMVQGLIDKGHAYVLGNDIYYDISTFEHYGALSGRKIDDMLAGARIEVNEENAIPAILLSGRGPNRVNRSGKVPGERDVPAGTLNAPPCLSIIWERLLISMAAAAI